MSLSLSYFLRFFATVFQLVKSKLGDDKKDVESSAWYALALDDCTESIHTSHERDRSQFQEGAKRLVVPPSLRGERGSEVYSSSIVLSGQLKQRIKSSGGPRSMEDDFGSDPMPSKAAFIRPVKKTATSARNFFGNNSKSTAGTTATTATSIPSGKQSAPSKAIFRGKNAAKPTQSSSLSFQPKKKETIQSNITLSKKKGNRDSEKENVLNKSSKVVGNADDFLGDMDDEDDDNDDNDDMVLEKDEGRSDKKSLPTTNNDATKGAKPKKTARRAYQLNDSDSDNESGSDVQPVEEHPEQTAKKNAITNDGAKQRRRRKRMVEKTFTDENGYLYTETQAVWEDVPSDEEDVSALASKKAPGAGPGKKAKKSSAPPKALKQGSIMGFFKKK